MAASNSIASFYHRFTSLHHKIFSVLSLVQLVIGVSFNLLSFQVFADGRLMVTDYKNAVASNGAAIRYSENWGASNTLDGWHDANDYQLSGDFMGLGYDQVMFINRGTGNGKLMIVDYKAVTPIGGVIRYSEIVGQNNLLSGWLDDNDYVRVGDFMGKGYDQVMFINRGGSGGKLMIVDYKRGMPTTDILYSESWGQNNLLGGWLDNGDLLSVGDFRGLGYDQALFVNRGGSGGKLMIVDYKRGLPTIDIRYSEDWGQSAVLDGWLDNNDYFFVGDFMGLHYDQVLVFNRSGTYNKIRIIDYRGAKPGVIRYNEEWGFSSLLAGWLDDNDTIRIGDFWGKGYDQVMYINRGGSGGKLMIVDYRSATKPGTVLYSENWGQNNLLAGWLDDGDLLKVGNFSNSAHTEALWINTQPPAGGTPPTNPSDPLDPAYKPNATVSPTQPNNIWITSSMQKVQPLTAPGTTYIADVSSARNSVASFQVHTRAGGSSLSQWRVDVSNLTNTKDNTVISSSNITVSRELYLPIKSSSDTFNIAQPIAGEDPKVPDALLPARDNVVGETRNAFPFNIPSNRNGSAWIDIFIPSNASAGWYQGTVTVRSGSTVLATMPLRLKVWNVSLPSTSSLPSLFTIDLRGLCRQHYNMDNWDCGQGGYDLVSRYMQLALDRRISIGSSVIRPDVNSATGWTAFDQLYMPFLNGDANTRLVDAKLTSLYFWSATPNTTEISKWAEYFRTRGWMNQLMFYRCDEPIAQPRFSGDTHCLFSQARSEEDLVHNAAPDYRTLLTTNIENATAYNLLDSVDILTPVVNHMQPLNEASKRAAYDSFLQRSSQKKLFWYQSCMSHGCEGGVGSEKWPSYMADATPMRNRIFQWLAYKFDVGGELYFHTNYCFAVSCGGLSAPDPFKSIFPTDFSGNGDGTLFYPGKSSVIGGTKDIPLSSIRMELIREGMQDYELLRKLESAKGRSYVMSQVNLLNITQAGNIPDDPTTLMTVREKIGDCLHAVSQQRACAN